VRVRILGREILGVERESKSTTENKIEPLKLRTPKEKVKPAAGFTTEGYATGTLIEGLGHAQEAVRVVLKGGESRADWETALFLMYLNGQSEEIERGLNFVEITKIRSFIREMDDKITPLPTKTVEQKMYEKPCHCPTPYPLSRITIDGMIRCSKHGSYVRDETGQWVPTSKRDIGNIPSGRTGMY
jgi:hypothetical protein